MADVLVKPAPGRRVRDPSRGNAPLEEGRAVRRPRNAFWSRRLRDGDVVEVQAETRTRRTRTPRDGEER